jgi:lipopolysaccharide export system permease protein
MPRDRWQSDRAGCALPGLRLICARVGELQPNQSRTRVPGLRMKVIERYILRRVFVVFIAALCWTLAIVWTTQVLARIDLVTDRAQSAFTFFEVASLILPSITPMVIPFALLIGVALTLSTMNTDSEMAVISAAGSSRMVIIRPIMILAVLSAIISFAIDNGVDPYARERSRQLIAESRGDLLSVILQEGTFRKVEDGLFVQIGQRLPDGNLGQIFVSDSRQEGVDLVYYAKSGSVLKQNDKNVLLMFDGVINRKAPSGEVSLIRFKSYAFDLAVFSNAAGRITMFPKDRTISYLANPDPNDPVFQARPQSFRAELHRRFIEWVYPITFALIAIAVVGNSRSHREARVHPLITAVIIALFWRWVGFFTVDRLQTAPWAVGFAYAAPIVPILLSIWFIATNRAMELPITLVERLRAKATSLGLRLSGWWNRLLGRGTPAGGAA